MRFFLTLNKPTYFFLSAMLKIPQLNLNQCAMCSRCHFKNNPFASLQMERVCKHDQHGPLNHQ